MNLNNGGKCNHSAISCPVPGSASVPFPGSAPSPTIVTTPQLFFTPLPPNPPPIPLPENTSNITIMEFLVPARVVAERPRVQLDATIGTEILAFPGDDAFFSVNDITYQLFRDNTLLTDTLVSGNYRIAGEEDLYTFNSTFTWVDTLLPTDPVLPGDPILPPDPIRYRVVANVGDYFHVTRAQVRNRGFLGVLHPPDPILPALPTNPV
ncbi:hypothetical protein [Bacillus sp. XF8]|uniref:hypothetical protein n=1 Tax=Bacillus sp. XF8 TaxID=2819289 RepID=UPI001AA0343A|nr:hypothetical protein [Bacillus sp. XF8]MBO1579985.1 hypothetical protein [Bacillus sp. XF8]